jgi:protein phosphatase
MTQENSWESALEMFAMTDTGLVRARNEDAIYANPAQGLVILADGMGGANAGDVASGMTIDILSKTLGAVNFQEQTPQAAVQYLYERIWETNQAVHQASRSHFQYAGMGATLVTGCFTPTYLYTAHMGDARAYRLRAGQLGRLTRDHSPTQELIDSGLITEAEVRHLGKNLVNRAIGVHAEADPEFHVYDVQAGDIYLFCSDGLNNMVDDRDIAHTLQIPGAGLPRIGAQLVHLANHNGGMDNISVILVKIHDDFLDTLVKTA